MADLTKAQLKAQVKDLSARVFQLKADFKAEQKARITLHSQLEKARSSVRTVEVEVERTVTVEKVVEKPVERVVYRRNEDDVKRIAYLEALVGKLEREAGQ
ncbi:MAG: hypothetical protein GOVbin4685_17 [Prokaryotic dsDNA virus sp.]|nr:MAG: hypothetical protein GOVbin4685_17 [Prokaryotic dsDNA virus sp.]